MKALAFLSHSLVVALCLGVVGPAGATVTYVEAYVDLGSGDSVVFHTVNGGAEGAQASADQGLVAHAESTSSLGSLHATSTTQGSGRAQSQAIAVWIDSFAITDSANPAGSVGSFSAAVAVQGELRAEFLGQAYGDSFIQANFLVNTGVEGGQRSAAGGGRRTAGSDVGTTASGEESFVLHFEEVPFVFGQDISTTLRLVTNAAIGTNSGSMAYASAAYGHTMDWIGLSNVRNSSGQLLNGYSAVSTDSGFNFAGATPVPEPAGIALVITGLALVLGLRRSQLSGVQTTFLDIQLRKADAS